MKFKKEVALLTIAMTLFVSSTLLYSYNDGNHARSSYATSIDEAVSINSPLSNQTLSLISIGFGSLLLIISAISYQKSSKQPVNKISK